MADLSIDVTNACNLDCIHCLRDKKAPREHISFDIFNNILSQARSSGISHICFTGGEPTIHPLWKELVLSVVENDFKFSIVTNGFNFKEKTLPILLLPSVRRNVDGICFSLDGACEESHDLLRNKNSFRDVIQAINLCKLKDIPVSLKSVIHKKNANELIELAMLGAVLGAKQHSFIALVPTPKLIDNKLMLSNSEMSSIYSFISDKIIPSIKTDIIIEGSWGVDHRLFTCNAYQQSYAVDHLGNLIFCCNLSHVYNGKNFSPFGEELLVSLKEETLNTGIVRHFELLAQFTKARIDDMKTASKLYPYPCWWCLKHFDKLNWLNEYSQSDWFKEFMLE